MANDKCRMPNVQCSIFNVQCSMQERPDDGGVYRKAPWDASAEGDAPRLPARWAAQPQGVQCSWFQVPCSWFQVPGSWFQVPGSWFLVPGSWFLVPCSWFLVPDSAFSFFPATALATTGRARPGSSAWISAGRRAGGEGRRRCRRGCVCRRPKLPAARRGSRSRLRR